VQESRVQFDALMDLHEEIKIFMKNNSIGILNNFLQEEGRFGPKSSKTQNKSQSLNISSNAVCTLAFAKYMQFWDENNLDYKKFGEIENYYEYILNSLKSFSEPPKNHQKDLLQTPDEFTILNLLSMAKKFSFKDNAVIVNILNKLCNLYLKTMFIYSDNTHPYIHYTFLNIIYDWKEELEKCIWDESKFKEVVDKIYRDGKYEMYRQLALIHSKDRSLFDVKRLIYSLLIVSMNNRYSNNFIKEKTLSVIFKEQLRTGMWPVGNVVNNEFVFENGEFKEKDSRIISASPILSSVECLNAMLSHKYICRDLANYHIYIQRTYEWLKKRLILEIGAEENKPQGWWPEYEGSHTPKSWLSGHALIFIKNYFDLISNSLEKMAKESLDVKDHEQLKAPKWKNLCDSYNIKESIEMLGKENYRSALIFGPPGSGKSTVSKSLAKDLGWSYVEITPGLISAKGKDEIIPSANDIFKKLNQLRETVIFFDEVDEFVKSRDKGGDVWIVTSLLPKFQELWDNKEIKFILATNDITNVDWAIARTGRIDFVLPMGAICWPDRLNLLRAKIKETINKDDVEIEDFKIYLKSIFADLFTDSYQIIEKEGLPNRRKLKSDHIKAFLNRTDFIVFISIKDILDNVFDNCNDIDELLGNEFFQIFFNPIGDASYKFTDFEDPGFRRFHELADPQDEKSEVFTGKFIMKHTKLPPQFLTDRTNKIRTVVKETVSRPYTKTI